MWRVYKVGIDKKKIDGGRYGLIWGMKKIPYLEDTIAYSIGRGASKSKLSSYH